MIAVIDEKMKHTLGCQAQVSSGSTDSIPHCQVGRKRVGQIGGESLLLILPVGLRKGC